MADLNKFEPTIGIECHVQLKTKSKLFARVDNDARNKPANTTVSPICFGLPGVLPYLNEEAIDLAIKAGVALNAKIAEFSKFDRKHYFYPDLPKGYQITQYDQPIIGEGYVDIEIEANTVRIGVERAHLEEDAGKLTHGTNNSFVDLNRAGTPLLEIVSKPDIKSPEAARLYARELYLLMKYAGVSDVDLYHGQMRFDVNISVAPRGSSKLGTRAEIKNLNSFKAVERAAKYEYNRQVELIEKGEQIIQETRGWDEAKQKTVSQRSKEEAHDYRYFPEPDLPPVKITRSQIENISSSMPLLHKELKAELVSNGVSLETADTLIEYRSLLEKFNLESKQKGASAQDKSRIANWLANVIVGELQKHPDINAENTDSYLQNPGHLLELSQMVEDGTVSSAGAKSILITHFINFQDPKRLAEEMDLLQVSDSSQIADIVNRVIKANPAAVADIRNGEAKAIGFLVGQVMKESKGQANPQMAQSAIKKALGSTD